MGGHEARPVNRSVLFVSGDAAQGKVTRVYVYRYDRLGRNESDTFGIVEELESVGADVISATEGRDSLTRGMMLVMSAHCSRELAIKTRNGLLKRHEQRAFTGGKPPFGFRVSEETGNKILAIDTDEAKIVRDVFNAYLGSEPKGLKSIARLLNDRGIPTRSMLAERQGKGMMIRRIRRIRPAAPWTKSSIRSILENPIYTGVVVYNRRHMKLDRKTGRRVPVLNDPTALKQYCDERLRIVADQQFAMAKERLSSRKRSTCGNARSADLIRTFTGHLFCDDCGSAFYSRKSKNAKGEYIYYQCGCRQRRGPESCPNAITLREDKLLAGLQDVCASAFSDIEAMIEASIVEAKKTAQVNGSEAERLRGELAQTDREIGAVASLLSDPDVIGEPLAKKAVLRRAADLEGRRDAVLKALDRLLDKSNDDTDRLADIVRERFLAAKQRWEDLASPAQLNQLIGELVGPSLVNSDGQLLAIPENKNPAYACGARGVIAGGGFEPPTSGL